MHEKIALMTDSGSDLPQHIIDKYNIKVVPLKVIYPDREYSDRVDIQPQEVYKRMPDEIPTTSMPSLEIINSTIKEIKEEGFTHLIAIHISSGLSGTYQSVELVAKDFTDDLVIKIIDSKTLSMATGLMVLDAARNIADGVSFENVIDKLNNLQPNVKAYYVIETLEYLRRGGRIGRVAGMLGQFLSLKPIISVDTEGTYYTYCKARGRTKSIEKLIQIVEDAVKDKQINLAVLNGGADDEFDNLLEKIKKLPNIKGLITSEVSPALCVHTGPGLLAVCLHEV
ncbi:DegV family protein [Candidatus Syntrophocurvum alkaliphilum]|uniref:DegV family protein n=1 Tax=Candidatus Syntrophocurvum alkaliphilum TaxID=2293317 RepID=A0A6I6DFR4_9FIRM|nr:DegV family protein [Candidatus Syntrophocurvum alkaliphilum]QGT99966.1 DegV family protein [Candidatus Syntrophocurvum alkaliphilum]